MDEDVDQVVPGGWKRIVLGFLLGLAAGALVALILPRDDGPRRRSSTLRPAAQPPTPADASRDSEAASTSPRGTHRS